jgi:hypothetical protein
MECFVANEPVDAGLLGVRSHDFGVSDPVGPSVVIRGHLATDLFIDRAERLFEQFIEDTLAQDLLEPEYARLLETTGLGEDAGDLRTHLSLGLRVFREFIPQTLLETLLAPPPPAPRYRLCTLDELRGTHGRIIFSGTAEVIEP